MLRIQWRLRTLLAATALIALSFSGGMVIERSKDWSADYARRSSFHEERERKSLEGVAFNEKGASACERKVAELLQRGAMVDSEVATWNEAAERYRKLAITIKEQAEYHALLKKKYSRAT